jgi:hypothetical protein
VGAEKETMPTVYTSGESILDRGRYNARGSPRAGCGCATTTGWSRSSGTRTSAPAFRGFRSASYTMFRDERIEELLADLSGAELKVLLFVVRRTFGFKRGRDRTCLEQMVHSVTAREGQLLHRGDGLSNPTLLGALRSLQAKGVPLAERHRFAAKGDEPTGYALRFAGPDARAAATSHRHRTSWPIQGHRGAPRRAA